MDLIAQHGVQKGYYRNLHRLPTIMETFIQQQLAEGLKLQIAGKMQAAEAKYRKAEAMLKNHPDTLHHLGVLSQAVGNDELAIKYLKKALAIKPSDPEILNNLGISLKNTDEFMLAIERYERALELNPELAPAHNNMGVSLLELDQYERAEQQFRRALAIESSYIDAYTNLGIALSKQNEFEQAREQLQIALSKAPYHIDALCQMATLCDEVEQARVLIKSLEQLVNKREQYPEDQLRLKFSLARLCEVTGDYRRAQRHLISANQMKSESVDYSRSELESQVNAIIHKFDSETISRLSKYAYCEQQHVFIVGLPRSGKSLLEHLLSAHPEIVAAGEQHILGRDLKVALPEFIGSSQEFPECMDEVTEASAQALVEAYEGKLSTLFGVGDQIVCNTMPYNNYHVGLLAALFKGACFIFCRRDLDDQAFFIYQKSFRRGHSYSYDLKALRHAQLENYRIMKHWSLILPDRILEVDYESTVHGPHETIKRVCGFLGIEPGPILINPLQSNSVKREISAEMIGHASNYPKIHKQFCYEFDGQHNPVIQQAIEKGDYRAAEEFCYSVLTAFPEDATTLRHLSECKLRQGKSLDAELIAQCASEIDGIMSHEYNNHDFA